MNTSVWVRKTGLSFLIASVVTVTFAVTVALLSLGQAVKAGMGSVVSGFISKR